MLIDTDLSEQLRTLFFDIQRILRDYQSFSVQHVRSLESQIMADALLEALSKYKFVFVDSQLEETYAVVLILLAHLKQKKSGKPSRLWSAVEPAYNALLAHLNNAQLIVALFQFYDISILIMDRRSWFFPEKIEAVRLTKTMLMDFYEKVNGTLADPIEVIVRKAFLSAFKAFPQDSQLEKNVFIPEAAVPFSRFTRIPFSTFQVYGCKDNRSIVEGKKIGSGAYGDVHLLNIQNSNKKAIQLAAKFFNEENTDEAYLNELGILCYVQHKNIIAVFPEYCVILNKNLTLVMEFCPNGDLNKVFQDSPKLLDQDKLALVQGILSGIMYLHNNFIVHGDLSGSNVVISRDGVPKICDFGTSVWYSSKDATRPLRVGCPDYLPPQLCRAIIENYHERKKLDSKAEFGFFYVENLMFARACERDIFAFMVILWKVFVNDSVHTDVSKTLKTTDFQGKDLKDAEIKKTFDLKVYHEMAIRLADNAYLKYAQDCQKKVVVKPMVTSFFNHDSMGASASLTHIQSQLINLQSSISGAR